MRRCVSYPMVGLMFLQSVFLGVVTSQPANPIWPAAPLLGPVVNRTANGKLYEIDHEGTKLKVVHVYGSPAEMGRASGELLGAFAREFVMEAMPQFYAAALVGGIGPDGDFDASSLPASVQAVLANASASHDAAAMAEAMIGPTLMVCASRYTREPANPPRKAAVNARRSA